MAKSLFLARYVLAGAVPLAIATGCSSGLKTYPVSGKVTFEDNGEPLFRGRVEFRLMEPAHDGQHGPNGLIPTPRLYSTSEMRLSTTDIESGRCAV